MYAETAPNARVWRTLQEESAIHDANMVEEFRDNVDVLLVFAGLFSAVVTTFVVQTSQSLQADYAQASASILFELLLVQRAIANGSSVDAIPVSSLSPQTAFVPSATDVWVNGLWFTSLFLSLTTALVAVLVKQWLHHYIILPSGTPRDRCFVRQYRYMGFQKWHVEVIVGLLPVLMHLALALFFVGLSLFLHPLRAALSRVICTGTVLLIVAYTVMTILPMCFPQCPYRTPLCDLTYPPYNYIAFLFQKHYNRLLERIRKEEVEPMDNTKAKLNSLKQLELDAVEKVSIRLSVEALHWLFSVSSNPTVQSVVVESIGGLPMEALVDVNAVFRGSPSIDDVRKNLLLSLTRNYYTNRTLKIVDMPSAMKHKFERLLRSCMFISWKRAWWQPDLNQLDRLDRNGTGATFVTQIPKLFRSGFPWGCGGFLHDILCLETPAKFPPIVWANLVQEAVLADWDPNLFDTLDEFPMVLCSAVTGIVGGGTPKQQLFASPLVVDFQHAVEYFPEMALKYIMCWLSPFDSLSDEHVVCRAVAASIHLMIHRLCRSAAGTDISETPEIPLLRLMFSTLDHWIRFRKNLESVQKILESIIVNTPIFSQDLIQGPNDFYWGLVLDYYTDVVSSKTDVTSHIHPSSSAIQLLFTFVTTQWSMLPTSSTTQSALSFLVLCLQNRIRSAYDAFYEQRCLEFLVTQPVSSWSALLCGAYVTGIIDSIPLPGDDVIENQTLQQAMDHLYEPENLFFVASTLAMYNDWLNWNPVYLPKFRVWMPNILIALARIRPFDHECRQRLRTLGENENCSIGSEGEDEGIKERRHNMHAAIEGLEASLATPPQVAASLESAESPQPETRLDHIGRLLPWRRQRHQDGEHQLAEGV
ncbi:uncharacterized protein EV420DRAFT_1100725 [Desarmillaria tabescens]|uniref:DUF6535 domain-containing protein n=1 Tax=Armillaria tabescens TaxID=1929756 RepID=A0AA39TZ79_ARMTA|nr:uncharacterized protein EV420DRAFT_1100725 [Desarmillaria tabescens]KAK0463650.1 hypothetical protein EV420DRAFT_1100725 [Desarmillaria tabescens]